MPNETQSGVTQHEMVVVANVDDPNMPPGNDRPHLENETQSGTTPHEMVVGNGEDPNMPPGDDRPHLETVISKPSEDNESFNTSNLTQMDENTTPVAKQNCNGNKLNDTH